MSPEDPYSTFRTAFEVQKSEIERLQNRVSELEKVNTEVLSYVKRRGSLPVLNYIDTNAEGCSGRSIDVDSEFNFESAAATSKESDMKFSLFGENAGDLSVTGDVSSTGSTLLSDLVAQHTLELDKALETLGLESSKRNQLLDQVRINVNSLLHNQLNSEFGSSARPAGLDQTPVPPLLCREKSEKLIPPASSGGDCTTQAGWPISSLDALAFDKPNAPSVHSSSRLDVQRIQAHHCSMQSAIQEVQEKRRMELMRLNNRMHLPPASETEAVIHTAAAHPVPSATSITTASPSVRNVSAAGLVQTNNDLEPCSLNGLPFHAISTPMLDNSKASVPFASPRLRSPIQQYRTCPCGNRQNCPLTPIKQRRFGNDPRVARGFTLLAAAFRGRLVRQLLATHKVCDLIRTVKDTAKLALSIHTERLSSFYQSTCNGSLLSNGHSAGQKLEGISSEELVLESRLMVQLRGALGQLHEVFFSWPLSNKLELLAISRSLTQRQKRLSNRFSNIREDSYSAEPMIDGWAPCEPMDASRRYQSGASHCSSRVLRQLQPDQVDRLSTPVMAAEPVSRETKKCIISTFRTDRISIRQCRTTANSTPRVMRGSSIFRIQPTSYADAHEKQHDCEITNSYTKLPSDSKATIVQKSNEQCTVIRSSVITTRQTAQLHPSSTAHSSHTEHLGINDKHSGKIDRQIGTTISDCNATTSNRSSQLFQLTPNVSELTNRATEKQPDRSVDQFQSTPSNSATSPRRSPSPSSKQQHTTGFHCHSARSSPDTDIENRRIKELVPAAKSSDSKKSSPPSTPSRWPEKQTLSVITQFDRHSGVQNTVANPQIDFRASRISGTRAILERSALAMATSASRPSRNCRRVAHAHQPQHHYSKRSYRANLGSAHANFHTRSIPDTVVGECYPVRRRIVANQSRSFVSSINTNQSNYIYPYSTGPIDATTRRQSSMFTRLEDQRTQECCYPQHIEHLESVAETAHRGFRSQGRRCCDEDRHVNHHPGSTRSPTRLQPESGCPGALRATWSLDSFNTHPR